MAAAESRALEAENKLAAAEESTGAQLKAEQAACASAVQVAEEARTAAETEVARIRQAIAQKEDQLHDARQRYHGINC